MRNQHLLDNWTLQNAGEFLCDGLIAEKSADVMRFEALCQVLHHVVFADVVFVDADFAESWQEFGPLITLRDAQVLATKPFKAVTEHWRSRRETMIEQLCFCPSVRRVQEENRARFKMNLEPADQLLSQLVWGGAGMLARADYFRLVYVPHPARTRLFARAPFLREPTNANTQVQVFVENQRVKLYEHADSSGFLARFTLPAVIVEIIDALSSLDELMHVALQVREKYTGLRTWLAEFQHTIDSEDIPGVLARKKTLQSIARDIDSRISLTPAGDTTLQLGISWLKLTTKIGSPLDAFRNRFGVRAQIGQLILNSPGRNTFDKLLKLLGEENSKRGLAFKQEFLSSAGKASS